MCDKYVCPDAIRTYDVIIKLDLGRVNMPLQEHEASPEMKKFFQRLLALKEDVKKNAEESQDPYLMEIYQELNGIIKEEK